MLHMESTVSMFTAMSARTTVWLTDLFLDNNGASWNRAIEAISDLLVESVQLRFWPSSRDLLTNTDVVNSVSSSPCGQKTRES